MADADRTAVHDLLHGAWITQALYVAAELEIADRLAAGPSPVDELSRAAKVDADALYRVLRALTTVGVFSEQPDRVFAINPRAELLRRDHPDSLRGMALLRGIPETYAAWGALLSCVETGRPGFDRVFGGARFDYFATHPEPAAIFNAAMDEKTRRVAGAIARSYDFAPIRRLVDVGGGHGRLLGAILAAHPHLAGTLFDMPQVVAGAPPILDELGVRARVEIVGGDFFASVPAGDGYILFNIVHDWSDADAIRILRTVARALPAGGRVLVVELIVPAQRNERSWAAWMDLNMLVALGGRERTERELVDLATAAGLRVGHVASTGTTYSVVECVTAS